jgi:hypothetical protein
VFVYHGENNINASLIAVQSYMHDVDDDLTQEDRKTLFQEQSTSIVLRIKDKFH